MKDSFETGMRMLSDMARHPAFAASEIERQRQQTVSSLRVNLEDPEYVANSVFDRLVYGFHPYGLPDIGTTETLGSITRDDIVAFHQPSRRTTPSSPSSATSAPRKRFRWRRRSSATGSGATCRARNTPIRRTRLGES
jgi:zinc protease